MESAQHADDVRPGGRPRDRFRLDGRTVVVTGASAGLGEHIAVACAEAGADLVLGARRREQLDRVADLVAAAGGKVAVRETDVRDPEACQALAQLALDTFGTLDGLVNNAGIATVVPAIRETGEQFRAVLDVNLVGAFQMAQASAARMADGGSIVNMGSMLGQMAVDFPHASYSASKAGLDGLTRDLAAEWTRRLGIRVNSVAPGFISSDMTAELPARVLEWITARLPVGRIGRPDEVVGAVVYLLSDASSYVTGSTLVIDGGALAI